MSSMNYENNLVQILVLITIVPFVENLFLNSGFSGACANPKLTLSFFLWLSLTSWRTPEYLLTALKCDQARPHSHLVSFLPTHLHMTFGARLPM